MLNKIVFVLLTLALMIAPSAATAAENRPRNIILFGWDGAQRNHVNECLRRNELPTLKKLINEGSYVKIDIEGITDTKAGWSQILTGYYPEVTGVYSNGRYQPIPRGLSIGERLEKHFGPDNIVTLSVIGKKGHVDADPPQKIKVKEEAEQPKVKKQRARKKQATDTEAAKPRTAKKKTAKANTTKPKTKKPQGKIIEENGVKYRLVPGKPHYNMSINTDLFENGLTLDKKVGTRAIELIEKHKDKPFFFFVHFAEVDSKGHKFGENSKEYNDALISNDTWTGKIMDKVKELGLADKTQYYITADHGFNEDAKGHGFAPYVVLATNNKNVNRDGRRQDVAPTILEAFGLDLSKLEPLIDGISLTKPDNRSPAKIGPAKKTNKTPTKQQATQNRKAGTRKEKSRL
jgi:hypothetical protein